MRHHCINNSLVSCSYLLHIGAEVSERIGTVGAQVSGHFGTSADMSYGQFSTGAEVSWVRTVLGPVSVHLAGKLKYFKLSVYGKCLHSCTNLAALF